jgi:hypothetical protein
MKNGDAAIARNIKINGKPEDRTGAPNYNLDYSIEV